MKYAFIFLLGWSWTGGQVPGYVWRARGQRAYIQIATVANLGSETYSDNSVVLIGYKYCYKVCADKNQQNCSNVSCAIAKKN